MSYFACQNRKSLGFKTGFFPVLERTHLTDIVSFYSTYTKLYIRTKPRKILPLFFFYISWYKRRFFFFKYQINNFKKVFQREYNKMPQCRSTFCGVCLFVFWQRLFTLNEYFFSILLFILLMLLLTIKCLLWFIQGMTVNVVCATVFSRNIYMQS